MLAGQFGRSFGSRSQRTEGGSLSSDGV